MMIIRKNYMLRILSNIRFSAHLVIGLLSVGFLGVPGLVWAQVLITEIMYAPEGVDTNREWVEVCNSGSLVDVTNWKFFENDTNHGLSRVSGSASLTSGSCAIIADNADVFLSDYPSFSGNLFDSTFSLKNTGETIRLKNEAGEEVDSATYSDADGAKDDGNSLHRAGSNFISGTPTPGSEAGIENSNPNPGDTSGGLPETTRTTVYSYESVTVEPPQDVYIRVPTETVTFVNSFAKFRAESYDATGRVVEGGRVTWAFGDGGEARGPEVSHQFLYPGEYITTVVLEYGTLFDIQQIRVTVVPLDAALYVHEGGDWVTVVNNSEHQLDVSQWRIVSSGRYFQIPENTVVPAKGEVRFASEVTKLMLPGFSEVMLVYPDGQIAVRSTEKLAVGTEENVVTPAAITAEKEPAEETAVIPATIAYVASAEAAVPVPEAVIEPPEVDDEVATRTATIILSSGEGSGTNARIYWYLGLAALLIFGASVVLLGQPWKLVVDGFEIVEADG
jgi:hypothetical protein